MNKILMAIVALTLMATAAVAGVLAGAVATEAAETAIAVETGPETSIRAGTPASYVDPTDMSTVPRLVRKILVRATAKARRGEHADAVAVLTEQLRDHPDQDHYLVRYHLARSYDALENYEQAREQYAQAVAMEPRLSAGWFGLGHVDYTLNDYEASGDAFLKSFQTDARREATTLYFAAAGYMLAEKYEEAAPLLDELCRGRWGPPRQDWYAQLASCAIKLDRPELAQPRLDEYLAGNPGSDDAWYLAYQFQVGLEDYREAAVALTMVGYLRELDDREQRTLGDLYNVIGVPALASERYATALGGDADSEAYERLVSALVAAHDLEGALNALETGLRQQPTARLWSLLGDVHYLRKDFAAAATAYAQVTKLDPDAGRPWLMIGYCHIELGNRGLAIQNLVTAAKYEDQADLAERLLMRARKMDQA